MSALLSVGQAHAVMPLELYETALKALDACSSLEETRHWDNKADALAAWAKIHNSTEAEIKAKRLKLHAYRRMGELAAELRPLPKGVRGQNGPVSLLLEYGLTRGRANAARFISLLPNAKFQELLVRPLAPTTATFMLVRSGHPVWRSFLSSATNLRACLRRHPPQEIAAIARSLGERQEHTLKALVIGLAERFEEFDQGLKRKR